jgi:hypothetical protein
MTCMNCGHDCHCKDTCNADSANGGCGCFGCAHPRKKSWWEIIKGWFI